MQSVPRDVRPSECLMPRFNTGRGSCAGSRSWPLPRVPAPRSPTGWPTTSGPWRRADLCRHVARSRSAQARIEPGRLDRRIAMGLAVRGRPGSAGRRADRQTSTSRASNYKPATSRGEFVAAGHADRQCRRGGTQAATIHRRAWPMGAGVDGRRADRKRTGADHRCGWWPAAIACSCSTKGESAKAPTRDWPKSARRAREARSPSWRPAGPSAS